MTKAYRILIISFSTFVCAIVGVFGKINHVENYGPECPVKFSSKNFDKYWPLLDLFNSCTFHISIKKGACWQLVNSFVNKCTLYQNCVSIYSGIHKKSIVNLQRKNSRQNTLEDTTEEFRNILSKHKHIAFCMVQLPSTIITKTRQTQLKHYMDTNKWNSLLSTSRRHPDYLIVPTLETPDVKSWNYLPKEWPSKVLILKGNDSTTKTIFLLCLPCEENFRLISLLQLNL